MPTPSSTLLTVVGVFSLPCPRARTRRIPATTSLARPPAWSPVSQEFLFIVLFLFLLLLFSPLGLPRSRFVFTSDYSSKEDEGRWTCVAGLMGRNDQVEEVWAHIKVSPHVIEVNMGMPSITILLISILLIMVALVTGFFVARNIPRKKETSILQNAQKYAMWKSFQSQFFISDRKQDTH